MSDKYELQVKIGQRIKSLRENQGKSQKDLALECGIEPSNFARLESGGTNPTVYTLKKISDCLNISIAELVSF